MAGRRHDHGADLDVGADAALLTELGENIRAARRARGWSLIDLEHASKGEFKSSVVGAYERGERAISVARLCRLAAVLGVQPATLLPAPPPREPVVVDLEAAEAMSPAQAEVIDRFLATIQTMRRGDGGASLSVRQSDLKVLAGMLESPAVEIDDQ